MAISEREAIIHSGSSLTLPELEQMYGFPVEVSGFESLQIIGVPLTDPGSVKKLLPDYEPDHPKYKPTERYQPIEAVCFLESGKPVMGIVSGSYFDLTEWSRITSLVNLADEPKNVILESQETEPLHIGVFWWPGYNIDKHEKNLGLGLETMSIKKSGDQFIISFPEGDTV